MYISEKIGKYKQNIPKCDEKVGMFWAYIPNNWQNQ